MPVRRTSLPSLHGGQQLVEHARRIAQLAKTVAAGRAPQTVRNLARLDEFRIDFIEQPVVQDPVSNMQEVRARCGMAITHSNTIGAAIGIRT